MGMLTNIFAGLQQRSVTIVPPEAWRTLGSLETSAGVKMSPQLALQITAVYACVRVISETLASLPLITYRRLPNGKERAQDHPLYKLLHDQPNPLMTAFNLRQTLVGHQALRGNAYAEIEFDRAGRVTGLWPLRPDRMLEIRRGQNGNLIYVYQMPQGVEPSIVGLPMERVMHVRGLGYDGIIGYNPIHLARNALGLASATEEHGARLFRNGAIPKVVLRHPATLSDQAYDRVKGSWEMRHQGLDNAHRTAILEEGMEIETIGIAPEDAQFLQTRKFQVTEIARMFRVPPHKIAEMEHATFSNIEHQSIEFVVDTVMPWSVNWEQEIKRSLLTEDEQSQYFSAFLLVALLRGDTKSRYEAYHQARIDGWLNGNEIREMEDMNPIPGEAGQAYWMPLNMIPAGTNGFVSGDDISRNIRSIIDPAYRLGISSDIEQRSYNAARLRHRLQRAQAGIMADVARRILRRERQDVMEQARKMIGIRPLSEFDQWLADFYQQHNIWSAEQMRPVMAGYAEAIRGAVSEEIDGEYDPEFVDNFVNRYTEAFASRESTDSFFRIRNLTMGEFEEPEEMLTALDDLFEDWLDGRANAIGFEESVRENNALAVFIYGLLGVMYLRSVAIGESCPYCTGLDGKVIGINEYFIKAGENYQPDGADKPLTSNTNKRHPPYHGGCDCMATASF